MIFGAIKHHVETHKDLTKIGKVFQFKLSDPTAAWVVDLKEAKVFPGEAKADTTLELSASDWIAMATGQANPQKLYFGGKLKISGDVMASQKLEFLKEVKPPSQQGAPAAAAPVAPDAGGFKPVHVFAGIRDHVEKHPELVQKIQIVYQWKLTNPDSSWILDLKNGKTEEGVAEKPDTTLELSESDFLDMSTGKADPQKLYFGGKLKISGNVMASQKLEFLKQIDRAAAAAAAAKVTATPAKPAAAPAAPKASRTPEVLAALKERLAKNPGLGQELGGTLQFKVGGHAFSVSAAGFAEGMHDKRDATITLNEDEDFLALAQDPSRAHDLFQRGRLRIDGNVFLAKKLGLIGKLV
jgi:3-hydroxyacyl-CoA dehydrogenase/3a,7a,12a-trihydroxy-5b-cholest-24-enoyl-CoA hydratase